MKKSRRLLVAASVGVLLLATAAGCAKKGKPRTALDPAPLAPGVAPVGSVGPAGSPGPGGSVGPGGSTLRPIPDGSGSPGHRPRPSTSSSKPNPKPSGGSTPSNQPTPPPIHNNYSIVAAGQCYWSILYNAGENDLMVAADFTVAYQGDQATPTMAPFTLTANPSDGYHSDGDVQFGTHLEETGGHNYQSSSFLGQQITVTGTLNVTDDIASDNAASITVSMPTLAQIQSVGIAPNTPHPTGCS